MVRVLKDVERASRFSELSDCLMDMPGSLVMKS